MDIKTIEDYRNIAKFIHNAKETEVPMALFLELLKKAEKLHEENQWLYGKLNIISDVIKEAREEKLER